MRHIAVIDYGMGNLRSVAKAIEHVATNAKVEVTADARILRRASHLVFPGVGAIRDCMAELQRLELISTIKSLSAEKPTLGICLGMQALMQHSEENHGVDTMGVVPGMVKKFAFPPPCALKIPHMGWNTVQQNGPHPLWHKIPQNSRFYFVHSYYVAPTHAENIAAQTEYGHWFASAIQHHNCFAVQFHPEKSQNVGLQLLENFVQWDGQ